MESMAVLSQNHTDLSSMDKPEVSKSLFGLIQWEEILRSGVFLAHRDVSLFYIRMALFKNWSQRLKANSSPPNGFQTSFNIFLKFYLFRLDCLHRELLISTSANSNYPPFYFRVNYTCLMFNFCIVYAKNPQEFFNLRAFLIQYYCLYAAKHN